MYFPQVQNNGNSRTMIDTWLGYNHNYRIANGELYDMLNLSSDNYPLLSPRAIRPRLASAAIGAELKKHREDLDYTQTELANLLEGLVNFDENIHIGDPVTRTEVTADMIDDWENDEDVPSEPNIEKLCTLLSCTEDELRKNLRGVILTDNKLTYIDGTDLHYGNTKVSIADLLEDDDSYQELYRFGAYLVMFPACVYINLHNTSDRGSMGAEYKAAAGTTITYTVCDASGNDFDEITASDEAPENASTGDRWLKTKEGEQGLYIYNRDAWEAVPTCYIRIDVPGAELTDTFSEGDVVFMNTPYDDFNNGSQIKAIDDESIVIIGLMDSVTATQATSSSFRFTLERRIPNMNYVCCDKNRMWGCYYGYVDGQMVNEIYASELGDFKNWYTYQGLANDSYAVSVGVPEEWTGCISYQGYPTFFKENTIYRVYGSMPSQYQINQINARGVHKGSSRSLAIVDEYLVYKSAVDICVFDGSSPRSISENLGRGVAYYDAVGGACINKYYVEMQTSMGSHVFFTYDFKTGLWMKENPMNVLQFTSSENGQMYACTSKDIYGMGITENMAYFNKLSTEEWVDWCAETGDMGFEYPDYKYVNRITVRANVPYRSELKLSISYDDRQFNEVGVIRGDSTVASRSLSFNPLRCDHFKIRFSGHGDCVIYTMAITLDSESEEDGY